MKSFIPWVGGKGKLLWIIERLAPANYSRFIDVFGGSGTVLMNRPIKRGCMEVYPQRGVCLYKCGNERYLLEVHAPPHKEALFGTAGGR